MQDRRITEKRIAVSPSHFYKGCAGKKRHPSKRAALGIARATGDTEVQVYKCRFCGNWHLGHNRRSE